MIAFFVQCTSQLWIMLSFKINRDYIAANLCINRFAAIPVCKGSCFLEKQLNEDQKQQQKFPDLKQKEINLFCQDNQAETVSQTLLLSSNISYPSHNAAIGSSAYLRAVFRPPSSIV
jgi:hypothetical protein